MDNIRTIDTPYFSYIVEKKRIRNMYIRVRNGNVYVTAPIFSSLSKIDEFVLNNKDLILRELNKSKRSEKYSLFGDECSKEDYDEYIKYSALNYLRSRTIYYFDIMNNGKKLPEVKLKNIKSAFGIYHSKNNYITFNTVILKYEREVIDYVVVHELAHMSFMDHSRKFWNYVQEYFPDYKKARRKLKRG